MRFLENRMPGEPHGGVVTTQRNLELARGAFYAQLWTQNAYATLPAMMEALCPPKPKLLLMM